MFSKDRLLEALEHAHQQEIAFIDRLSDQERTLSGQPESWSVKDIIAHLAVWRMRQLDRLQAGARGETVPPSGPDFDHTNQEIFEEHRGKMWDEVQRMLDEAHHRALDYVRITPDEELTRAAEPEGRAPWNALLAENVSHAMAHLWQFYLERGQPEQAITLQESVAQSLESFDDPVVHGYGLYNLACVYSLAGRHEDAIRTLGEALRLNSSLTEWSKQDPDLNALHGEAGYQALYA